MKSGRKIRFDSLADTMGFQLRRASHAMQQSYEAAFEPFGLRISDATVLIGIGENPGCTQADLSRSLRAKAANLVPIVAGLVSRELVTRVVGEGRAVSLHLTEEGVTRLAQIHEAIHDQEEWIGRLLAGIEPDLFLSVLKAIAKKTTCQEAKA